MQSMYDVVLSGSSFASRAAPGDGFFDPKGTYSYMDEGSSPTDTSKALAKTRGLRRYKNLIMQLHAMTNVSLASQTITGADGNTSPSRIDMRLVIDHGDGSLVTDDEYNPGQRLTGVDAITRCIARAFLIDEQRNMEVWDTTETTFTQDGTEKKGVRGLTSNIARVGPLADSLAAAEAAIMVTKVS